MTTICSRCGDRWSGHKVEHCTVCHLTFSATRSGDAHRTGKHGVRTGPDRRRCLTVPEMRSKTIGRGALKGHPFFSVTTNRFGTEIWGVTQAENPLWNVPELAENR